MPEEAKSSPHEGGFRFKVRGPRDFYGGLALVILAIVAFWAADDLSGLVGFAFGPGTAPRMFAGMLAAIGAILAGSGLLVDGPPLDSFAIRGPAFVIVAILVFAGMIRGIDLRVIGLPLTLPPLGLVPSTFFAFMISILGSSEFRWVESLLAAAAMTMFCVLLFVYLLQLPFELWPMF